MRSITLVVAAALTLVAGLSAAVAQAGENQIVVDGSTTVGPIAKAFAEYYMQMHSDVNITVSESGSGNGAKSLINGTCHVADMSRFMKDSEFAAAVKSGIDIGGQAEIHEDAIRELGISFEAEVTPLVVDVQGETVELTGSAEKQYQDWRRLMKSAYFTETGLGGDDIRITPKPAAEAGQSL